MHRQNVTWLRPVAAPTVMLVDDQRSAFKSTFAVSLLALRADSPFGSQGALAKALNERAPTREATYRRWEDMRKPHLPDAWQIAVLCELLGCEPDDFIRPKELSPREREMARRIARGKRRGQDQADGAA